MAAGEALGAVAPQWDVDVDDTFSFDDSERFEEDSLCSWLSESESVTNNWSGWAAPGPSGASISAVLSQTPPADSTFIGKPGCSGEHVDSARIRSPSAIFPLSELCAIAVATKIPFEVVESFLPPIPENLQIRIGYWSFPSNVNDIRLYSCLANYKDEKYNEGEALFRSNAVTCILQIGFHLSAHVDVPDVCSGYNIRRDRTDRRKRRKSPTDVPCASRHPRSGFVRFDVAVTIDRRHITACTCTCTTLSNAWCAHVVAVCLHRIQKPSTVQFRAPVSESLSRLHRDQLQKFAQYLINEQPQAILPTAQRLLDELLDQKSQALINVQPGAPDPTAGSAIGDDPSWCFNSRTLKDNIRSIVMKFCVPAPTVLSDVNYLSATTPPAATEWLAVLQALVGRMPEGLWNFLSIVEAMYRRHDENATHLLDILTEELISCDQVVVWWYNTRFSQTLIGNQLLSTAVMMYGHSSAALKALQHASNGAIGNLATTQYSCSLLCDELIRLWRLAALDPSLSPEDRQKLLVRMRHYHVRTVEKIEHLAQQFAASHSQPQSGPDQQRHQANRMLLPICARVIAADGESFRRFCLASFPGFGPAIAACAAPWRDNEIEGVTYQLLSSSERPHSASSVSPQSAACYVLTDLTSAISPEPCSPNSVPVIRNRQRTSVNLKFDDRLEAKSESEDSAHSSTASGSPSVSSDCLPTSAAAVSLAPPILPPLRPVPTSKSAARAKKAHHERAVGVMPQVVANGTAEPSLRQFLMREFDNLDDVPDAMSSRFACAEALYAHHYAEHAYRLCTSLAQQLMADPPDLLRSGAASPIVPSPSKSTLSVSSTPTATLAKPTSGGNGGSTSNGRRKKRTVEIPQVAHPIAFQLSDVAFITQHRILFLASVLAESKGANDLAFNVALFGLEIAREPAATKFLEVRLSQMEHQLVDILRKMKLTDTQLEVIRDRAARFRNGYYIRHSRPVLPLHLATFVYESLANRSADKQLAFEAGVGALGLRSVITESDHPLLCEGIRRQRGDLALTLLLRNKDHIDRIALIMDRLLDSSVHRMYRLNESNAAFYGEHLSKRSNTQQILLPISLPQPSYKRKMSFERCNSTGRSSVTETQSDIEPSSSSKPPTLMSDVAPLPEMQRLNSVPSTVPTRQMSCIVLEDADDAQVPVAEQPIDSASASTEGTPKQLSSTQVPTEAQAHFMFELGKSLLTKAGGSHSTAIFTAQGRRGADDIQNRGGNAGGGAVDGLVGLHRGLHLCSFQIGLYALGLHNKVSPNWLSRTYSSHVSWLSGQAMEIGSVALRILIDSWEEHLTPTEVATLADKASQCRDTQIVGAAADLALSVLPQSAALNPSEINRALQQCREQNTEMLERACLAIEASAQDGGVYPEVLYMVARQWFSLYIESGGSETASLEHLDPALHQQAAAVSVALNTSPAQHQQQQIMQQVHSVSTHRHSQMPGHYRMPSAASSNHLYVQPMQLPTHPQYMAAAQAQALQQHFQLQQQQQHQAAAAMAAAAAVHQQQHQHQQYYVAPYTQQQLQSAALPGSSVYSHPHVLRQQQQQAPAYHPVFHSQQSVPMGNHAAPQSQNVAQPLGAAASLHISQSAPSLPSLHPQRNAVPSANNPHSNQNRPPAAPIVHHQPGEVRYLYAAYRVGILATKTMRERIHDDQRNYVKYAQNPPYGDDVKWLFKVAKKLGYHHCQDYCIVAASSIVSPFVLYDLAVEASAVIARGTAPLAKALLHPVIQPLIQKCLQMFAQASHQKLSHPRFTPSDAEELVNLVRAARQAYLQTPGGSEHFSTFLHSLRKHKACKNRELWTRLTNAT